MKKVKDWNIKLTTSIQNNNRKIDIICSVHANIHQIKIEIVRMLGLVVFDTEIDLIHGGTIMKPTSTLLQNGIESNTHIMGVLTRMKENRPLDVQGSKKKPRNVDDKIHTFGLSVLCSCSNIKCMNFDRDMWINLGYGMFPLLNYISDIKCSVCPNRHKSMKPTMHCKQVIVSKGVYQMSGSYINNVGLSISKKDPFKKAVEPVDLRKETQGWMWNPDLKVIVKQI